MSQAMAPNPQGWKNCVMTNLLGNRMYSVTRYVAAAAAFVALNMATVVQTVPEIEAEVMRQADAVIGPVKHMVVTVDGRDITLRGKIRSPAPGAITPTVFEILTWLDGMPAIDEVDAQVELLTEDENAAGTAATLIRT